MGITQKEESIKLLFLIFIIILAIPFSSAELLIGQTNALYNAGDPFEIKITITVPKQTTDFLTAALSCEQGGEVELFKSPYTIGAGTEKESVISTNLENFLLGGLSGMCFIKAKYSSYEASSQNFEISRNVDVTLNIDGVAFSPEDSVKIFGSAVKSTGEPLDGFVELTVPQLSFSFSNPIKEGKFDFNFTVPQNAFSGIYEINAHAYEKDDAGELLNEGNALNVIKIKQVMKEIDIVFANQEIFPGNDFNYSVVVYDQAGEVVDTNILVDILTPNQKSFKKTLIKVGESNFFFVESNYTPGYWTIKAKISDLEAEKTFFVEEKKEVVFSLENQTLIITNVGNVPYDKPIEINIGGISKLKQISNLPVGGSKKFKLVAPDGEYQIEISDGNVVHDLGMAPLTGSAISVQDIGSSLSQNLMILGGIIAVLIIAIILLYVYRRISIRKSAPFKTAAVFAGANKPQSVLAQAPFQKNVIDKGERQESDIISLVIKNEAILSNLQSPASQAIESALWKAKEEGGKVYSDGNFRVIVFAEILTREKDNSLKAIRVAQTIERILADHNRRFAQKIDFGISVNRGNLIVEATAGNFRFISADNSIATTKKISQFSQGEVLISEILFRKTVGKIKVEKLKNQNLWKVVRVIDRSAHQDYIKNLTARQRL